MKNPARMLPRVCQYPVNDKHPVEGGWTHKNMPDLLTTGMAEFARQTAAQASQTEMTKTTKTCHGSAVKAGWFRAYICTIVFPLPTGTYLVSKSGYGAAGERMISTHKMAAMLAAPMDQPK